MARCGAHGLHCGDRGRGRRGRRCRCWGRGGLGGGRGRDRRSTALVAFCQRNHWCLGMHFTFFTFFTLTDLTDLFVLFDNLHAILQADVRDHFKLRCCDGVIDALRIPGCCPWRILHFVLFFHGFHHRSLQGLKLKPWRRKSSLGNLDESMNMVENDNNTSFDIFLIMLEIESTPTERDWLHCPQDRSFFTKETGWLIGLATWQFPKVVRGRRKHITCKIQINRYKWCEMDVWWRPR